MTEIGQLETLGMFAIGKRCINPNKANKFK
jgi:hypothetical protein